LDLLPGDKLFLYTDGILEMRNDANEQFGEEDCWRYSERPLSPRQMLLR
jgi:serine phosphatase RsbU (regulator of sigma subunit)